VLRGQALRGAVLEMDQAAPVPPSPTPSSSSASWRAVCHVAHTVRSERPCSRVTQECPVTLPPNP